MPSRNPCRFCKATFTNFNTLKEHVQDYHPQDYRRVRLYLGDTEQKLATEEILAAQGMIGHRETKNG
jgi:hypothetical protein